MVAKKPFDPLVEQVLRGASGLESPTYREIATGSASDRERYVEILLARARGGDHALRSSSRMKLTRFMDAPVVVDLMLEALELPDEPRHGNDRQAAFDAFSQQLPDRAVGALRKAVDGLLDVFFRTREDPWRRTMAAQHGAPALAALAAHGDVDAPIELAEMAKDEFPHDVRACAFEAALGASIKFPQEILEDGFDDGLLGAGQMLILRDETATERVLSDWERRDFRLVSTAAWSFASDPPMMTPARQTILMFALRHSDARPSLAQRMLETAGPGEIVEAICRGFAIPLHRRAAALAGALAAASPSVRSHAARHLDTLPADLRAQLAHAALADEPEARIADALRRSI